MSDFLSLDLVLALLMPTFLLFGFFGLLGLLAWGVTKSRRERRLVIFPF